MGTPSATHWLRPLHAPERTSEAFYIDGAKRRAP